MVVELLLLDVLLLRLLLRDTTAVSRDDGACGRPLPALLMMMLLPLLLLPLLLPPANGSKRGGLRLWGVVVESGEKETGRKANLETL